MSTFGQIDRNSDKIWELEIPASNSGGIPAGNAAVNNVQIFT
jgi:hypothetical protein